MSGRKKKHRQQYPAECREQLRKEVKNLRIEGEILGRAAAWSARESGSPPPPVWMDTEGCEPVWSTS